MKGGAMVAPSWGPMGRDLDALVTVLRHLWTEDSLNFLMDSYTAPVPFQETLFNDTKKLKIGYYADNGYFEATPAIVRAIDSAKAKLEAAGHQLIPWNPPDVEEALILHQSSIRIPDGGAFLRQTLDRDIREPLNARYPHFDLASIPVWLRHILSSLLSYFPSGQRLSLYLRTAPRTTSEVRAIYARIANYRASFNQKWLESGLDCLICPVHACAAPPNDVPQKIFGASTYPLLYNLLDYPAGTVPWTSVTDVDEKRTERWYPKVPDSETLLVRASFSEDSVGLPVCVQCVALPYRDEICLRLMRELESLKDA